MCRPGLSDMVNVMNHEVGTRRPAYVLTPPRQLRHKHLDLLPAQRRPVALTAKVDVSFLP